jgi:hypothetical protein
MSALKRPQPPDRQSEAYLSFVLRVGPLSKMEDPVEMTFRVQNVNRNTVEHFSDANTALAFISAAIDRFAQRPLH